MRPEPAAGPANRHAPDLDEDQRNGLLRSAGVNPALMDSWTRLGSATFNTAYRVRLADGAGLVVKVAPGPGTPTMSYEHDMLRTEAMFYRAVAGAAPVPRLVAADFSRRVVDRDVLVMTELPGQSWHDRRARMTGDERIRLRRELGGVLAGVHRRIGPRFGYPQGAPAGSWRSAFPAMVEAVLGDAERFGVTLPRPADRIRDAIFGRADALDEVTTPVLVHFDLWAGNILLGRSGISGLIDAERAFWGDPLADLVSPALFGDIRKDQAFLAGYLAGGGAVPTGQAAAWRLAMYRCYLYLIMLVETVPRGHTGPGHRAMSEFTGRHLVRALAALDPRTAT